MPTEERLALIQMALGKASVAFMAQPNGGQIMMPTEELLEVAQEIHGLWSTEVATAESEIARLKRALVWAVRHGASEGYDGNSWPCIWYSATELVRGVLLSREACAEIDGTDESLIATVCRLAEEG